MYTTTDAAPRRTLDVAHLPTTAWDWHSPVWWGNTLLIFIETTTLALMLVTYFYIWRNFDEFPPPKVDVDPPIYNTDPRLTLATADTLIVVASCALMYWTDKRARRLEKMPVLLGLSLMFVVAIIICVLRAYEFRDLYFWWNDNAYASAVWTILALHLTYVLAALLEFFIMGLWVRTHGLEEHYALDVTLAGGFWYWVAATWVIVYAVVFWSPRLM